MHNYFIEQSYMHLYIKLKKTFTDDFTNSVYKESFYKHKYFPYFLRIYHHIKTNQNDF